MEVDEASYDGVIELGFFRYHAANERSDFLEFFVDGDLNLRPTSRVPFHSGLKALKASEGAGDSFSAPGVRSVCVLVLELQFCVVVDGSCFTYAAQFAFD